MGLQTGPGTGKVNDWWEQVQNIPEYIIIDTMNDYIDIDKINRCPSAGDFKDRCRTNFQAYKARYFNQHSQAEEQEQEDIDPDEKAYYEAVRRAWWKAHYIGDDGRKLRKIASPGMDLNRRIREAVNRVAREWNRPPLKEWLKPEATNE